MIPTSNAESDLTESVNSESGHVRHGVLIRTQFIYGMGHILNDMCASMWFTYLLVYFHLVLGFDATQAGAVLLVGQVADALATPFVGYFSDTSQPGVMCGYGRRKTWHLFGTIFVLCAFPFIFSPCVGCENAHPWAQLFYYSAFVVVFQIGWAAVQVSHLSLIPELSADEHERTHLTAIRYSFTVFSNVVVYVVTWLVLHLTDEADQQIGRTDVKKFQEVVVVGVSIGGFTSLLFHLFLREPQPASELGYTSLTINSQTESAVSHRSMLGKPSFYKIGVVYTGTRLFVNLSQVLIPLYLHRTLHLPGATLASIPLTMYLASFVASLAVRPLNRHLGRKGAYAVGAVTGCGGCIWMFLGSGESYAVYQIYCVAVLFGIGGAVMLVTSLGLTADLIGSATNTAAFVYGTMSFSDKLTNGIVIVLIQHLSEGYSEEFYQWALPLGCGCSALMATAAAFVTRSNSQFILKHSVWKIGNTITRLTRRCAL